MSDEVRTFEVIVPAGTTKAAPLVTNLTMPARVVDTIEVIIPPGPNGTVGFAFGAAGQRVIPYNANAWIVGNDEKLSWSIAGQIDSGAWQLFAYNTGVNQHTLYVRLLVSVPGKAAPAPAPTLITPAAIEAAAPEVGTVDQVDTVVPPIDAPAPTDENAPALT